jgi:hypothetical protein
MQGERFQDRRIFGRISVDLPTRIKDPFDHETLEVSCRNISAGGIGVISSQVLLPKAPLEIWLDLGDKREPLHLYGKVIWSEQIEKDRWRAGICFDEPQFMSLWRLSK